MRNQRSTLLAGLAALALIAGTGLASAQEPSPNNPGAPAAKAPPATQQMTRAPAAAKMRRTAQGENPGAGPNAPKPSHHMTPANRGGSAARMNIHDNNRTARTGINARTAAHNGMLGLQANASGVNVRLNEEQRTRIRTTVLEARTAPRANNVNFDITVGTVVPRGGIHVVPVPARLAQIEPAWRGFLYFVYQNEVVIVKPRDMKIVAVVTV